MTSANDNSPPIAGVAIGGANLPYTATTAYDPLNRPTGVSWSPAPAATPPASGTLVTFGYTYNAVNQRVGETASDSSWLGYPSGSGTTAYSANSLNQYTAVGAVTPTYDGNGNVTSDGTAALTYDSENRLVAATGSGNTAAYAFDARGRRKLRTVNGTTTITVTGADDRALLDYDGTTGAVLRWYATGPGPNAVLGQMNVAAGTRDTLLPDTLGSVIASVDGDGTVTKFGYQPFGQTASLPAQFGFTGQRPDQETGLYYYRARHYSPEWGRFTQPDPIGYGDGTNLYAYVYNDPLNLLDPEGLAALNAIQAGLTVASFCPSVCGSAFSLMDAGISAARGDYIGAGISLTAAGIGVFSDAGALKVAALGAMGTVDALKAAQVAKVAGGESKAVTAYLPPNNGFLGSTERQFLMPGQVIDRYGGTGFSRFFSPAGTQEAARSLPAWTAGQPLRTFEVVKPFEVQAGLVAPAAGQIGLGTQYLAPVRLDILLKRGVLKEVAR